MLYPAFTVTAFYARPLICGSQKADTALTPQELRGAGRSHDYDNDILLLPIGAQRHQGGANYLFGDGHVKWYRPEQLSTARQSDGVNPGFGL